MITCAAHTIFISLFYIPFYFVISTGIVSNILLLLCLIKDPLKCFRNSASYFIMSLSVSDVLVCICRLIEAHCQLGTDGKLHFLLHFPLYVSMFGGFFLACDRYFIAVFPLKYKYIVTWRVTLTVVIIHWVFSFGLATMEGLYGNSSVGFYLLNILFTTTLVIGLYLYAKTAWVLYRQSQYWNNTESQPENFQIRRLQNQRRFIATICLVSVTTVVCFVPIFAYVFLTTSSSAEDKHMSEKYNSDKIYILLNCLFSLNFTVNLFIYIWRLKNYRATVRTVVCGWERGQSIA